MKDIEQWAKDTIKGSAFDLRAQSLKWWRALSEEMQCALAQKHYPEWPFRAVTSSSRMVERIYREEMRGFI